MTDIRETQLEAMSEAGQKLAVRWGHQPWSDSWARQVAEALLAAAESNTHDVLVDREGDESLGDWRATENGC